ncbi:hypothetical protein [Nonomuraea sp. NPDC049758]|uniref:hypothetical protein n=1 Tax=Nonomuraea sp. NPDC049758 TaxID=3154360 RepID=UPI0034203A3D
MTVAATQGATLDRALVYGYGLDPHSLYAAMSRDREAACLYLPRELLESDADRARLGEPEGHEVELQRAVAAYAATLRGDRADRLITAEPEPIARHHAERAASERGDEIEHGVEPPAVVADPDGEDLRQARRELADAEREAMAAVRRAGALLALTRSPYGVGLLTDGQLAARQRSLGERVTAAAAAIQAAEQEARLYARDGGGPAEQAALLKRARLVEQARQVQAAEQAARRLQQARQDVADGREQIRRLVQRENRLQHELDGLGHLRPSHRARRRELEIALPQLCEELAAARERVALLLQQSPALEAAAEQAAALAPPVTTWPLIWHHHLDLERDLEDVRRGARARDVDDAAQRAGRARQAHQAAQAELAAVHDERRRRTGLPPDRRDIECAARADHAQRQREASGYGDGPVRPAVGRQSERARQQPYRPPPVRGVDRGPGLSR